MVALSVLDQSPVPVGTTPAEALRSTIELARACDRLGYTRFWVAEHHNSQSLAGTAPEVLVPSIAAHTAKIRVGSGGVMLSHYSSFKVAEAFRVLEALYPGRIDLGIGRAPGSDGLTAAALQHGPGALGIEYFPEQIRDLVAFLHDEVDQTHPFARVHAMPLGASAPEVWLLGSSGHSAAYAAHFGLAFSFAHFISPIGGPEVVEGYRQHFRPSAVLTEPRTSIGVSVLCADTEAEADRLAASWDLQRLRRDRGERGPVPSLEEALAYPYTPPDRAIIAHNRQRLIVGGPDSVRSRLLALTRAYGTQEIVVLTICHDFGARVHSYELLAEAFALAELPTLVSA